MWRDISSGLVPIILMLLLAVMLAPGCAPVHSRPCPYVTEFPTALQRQAAAELRTGAVPALDTMMEGLNRDRAANRAICPA